MRGGGPDGRKTRARLAQDIEPQQHVQRAGSAQARLAAVGECFAPGDNFLCPCGEEHKFNFWAAAHWDESFQHICPSCERRLVFERGLASDSWLHDEDEEDEL